MAQPTSGQLPYSKGILYTASANVGALRVRLVNNDTGTSYATVNLYQKPRDSTVSIPLLPRDTLLIAYGDVDILSMPMRAGDVIEGDCSSGSYVYYLIG